MIIYLVKGLQRPPLLWNTQELEKLAKLCWMFTICQTDALINVQTGISASTKTICTWLCLEKSTFSQLKRSNKRKCETMLSGLSYILLGFLKSISSGFTCQAYLSHFLWTHCLKKTLYTTLNTISCSTSGKKLLKQSCEREKLSIPHHSSFIRL